MRHSFRRLVARATAGGAAAAIVGLPIIVPAAATTVVPENSEQLTRVELHTLEPAAPEPGEPVVVTGSITNVTDELLSNVQALLRYDRRPIASRADIARVSTDPEIYWGWRPGHIYDMVRDDLAPGESAQFTLEFVLDRTCADVEPGDSPCLDLPESGVYAIGVDANVTSADGDRHTGGTARTVVPWLVAAADPVDVALIWPLVGMPQISDDALRQERGASTREASGRSAAGPGEPSAELMRLLNAPGDTPVTWAVDPAAWTPEVATTVGSDGQLVVLPPAVPDVGALARESRSLADSVAAEAGRLQREFSPDSGPAKLDVAWPGAGVVSKASLRAWATAGYDTMIMPRDAVAMPQESPVAAIDSGAGQITAILSDPGLDSAIADNASTSSSPLSAALDLRQRFLAETALARDAPFRSGAAALVTSPPAGWQPPPAVVEALLDVWTGTDWITPVELSQVTDRTRPPLRPAAAPSGVVNPLQSRARGLPGDYVREVSRLHDELAQYHSLVGEPGATSSVPAVTTAKAVSALWQHDLGTARDQVAALRTSAQEALTGVSVVVNPSNTLSGNSGVFPVNIANDLARAVTVRLEFDPANQDRIAIEPVEAHVPGGQQRTVQVRAEAIANGEVPVSVQLETVDGAPLGSTKQTIVNATHYGTIGWFVVGGSALLFAVGLSWRMVRGRRRSGP